MNWYNSKPLKTNCDNNVPQTKTSTTQKPSPDHDVLPIAAIHPPNDVHINGHPPLHHRHVFLLLPLNLCRTSPRQAQHPISQYPTRRQCRRSSTLPVPRYARRGGLHATIKLRTQCSPTGVSPQSAPVVSMAFPPQLPHLCTMPVHTAVFSAGLLSRQLYASSSYPKCHICYS